MPKPTKFACALAAPSDAEQQKLGRQIEDLYVATTEGMVDCIALGDLVRQAEGIVSTVDTIRTRGGGRDTKGEGLKGWLAKFAPSVPRATAYRFRDLADNVRETLGLGARVNLAHVLKGEKLDAKENKLREKVCEFAAGKSQKQILLGVGKYDAKQGGRRNPEKLTEAERHERAVEAARSTAIGAFSALHEVDDRWMLLRDEEVEQAMEDAKKFAAQAKAWLETPAPKRAQFKIEKYLGAEEAK